MKLVRKKNRYTKYIKDPLRAFAYIVVYLDKTVFSRKLPDKFYLKCKYYRDKGEKLNLKNPPTFHEKLHWLKLYNKNPLYIKLADKYEVREYVDQKIGKKYLIPLLGVWDTFDKIDFTILPNEFILKCNHDSGSVVFCKCKEKFDIKEAREKLEKRLKMIYGKDAREWVYEHIKPRIIAEKYLLDLDVNKIYDYKFFCFNGEPKCLYVASVEPGKTKAKFYDLSWTELPFTTHLGRLEEKIEKPKNFHEMIDRCKKLSDGINFVRVDLYNIDGEIYFGELTFFPHGGDYSFDPPEWNKTLGGWLKLPEMKKYKITKNGT
jgi:hypothetical protein